MSTQKTLQNEIEDSKRWIACTVEDSTYKRDLIKRIELINWVLENMNNPYTPICENIESKMNEILDKTNKTDDAIEADPLDSQRDTQCNDKAFPKIG